MAALQCILIQTISPRITVGTLSCYNTHAMQFDRPDLKKTEHRPGIKEIMENVREALGTYSNRSFYADLHAIASDKAVPEHLRDRAQNFLHDGRNHPLSWDIVDAIVARRLPRAPEGYLAIETFRLTEHLGVQTVHTAIEHCLAVRGVPVTILTNRAEWEKHKAAIGNFCVYARGGNGIATVFFSPQAQQEILAAAPQSRDASTEVLRERSRPPEAPSAPSVHAVEIAPAPPVPEHETQIAQLRERLSAIRIHLYRGNRQEVDMILRLLTNDTAPHDAQHYALRISQLEIIARRNQHDD